MSGPARFSEMACISPETLAALHSEGFTTATPVQEAVIPLFCGNKDVAVDAATGSGKTLAFVVPLVERMRKMQAKPKPNETSIRDPVVTRWLSASGPYLTMDGRLHPAVIALAVAPTRELAGQIHRVARPFVESVTACGATLLTGGTDVAVDLTAVRACANVLIGTPGRIHDIMKRVPELSFRAFEVLVLDEADRLLEMGFQRQLNAIMAALPKQRRTGLFSATQTEAVEALVRAGLRNPFRVNVAVAAAAGQPAGVPSQKTPTTLDIQYLFTGADGKVSQLLAFFAATAGKKVIVYFLTCASVDYYAAVLPQLPGGAALPLMALHGSMKQAKRAEVLERYAAAPAAVLLCTDLAARGLDIPDVHWILHFDPPQDPAAFVHRCGRTARMGRSGDALALLLPAEDAYVNLLQNRNVPLRQRQPFPVPHDPLPALRRLSETDRDAMEKGTKAFVSYMRGYKEHQCKFIFRVPDLDVNHLGRAFGLLRLPAMKEVRKNRKGLKAFEISEVDPAAVPYRDAAREKARQKQLAKLKAEGRDADSLRAERQRDREAAAQQAAKDEGAKKLPAAKRQLLQQRKDRDDLDSDYTMLKRLKRGKISAAEYDVAIGIAADAADDAHLSHSDEGSGSDDEPGDGAGKQAPKRARAGGADGWGDSGDAGRSRTARKRRNKQAAAARTLGVSAVGAADAVGADGAADGIVAGQVEAANGSAAGPGAAARSGSASGDADSDAHRAALIAKRKAKKARLKRNKKARTQAG